MKVLENGDAAYQTFRNERYVVRSKKLSDTISKVNLPAFGSQGTKKASTEVAKHNASAKAIACRP